MPRQPGQFRPRPTGNQTLDDAFLKAFEFIYRLFDMISDISQRLSSLRSDLASLERTTVVLPESIPPERGLDQPSPDFAPTLTLRSGVSAFYIKIIPPTSALPEPVAKYDLYWKTDSNFTTPAGADFNRDVFAPELNLMLRARPSKRPERPPSRVIEVTVIVQEADLAKEHFFRARTVLLSNAASNLSSSVSGFPLTSPGSKPPQPAGKPDPPTLTVAYKGSTSPHSHLFEVGITFSTDTNTGGVSRTDIHIAATGDGPAFDVSTGFDLGTQKLGAPSPEAAVEVLGLGAPGEYQFTARIFNSASSQWSDFSTPVKESTTPGAASSPDTDVPGPASSFIVRNVGEPGGNRVEVEVRPPVTNNLTIWGIEVIANTNLYVLGADDLTGLTNTGSNPSGIDATAVLEVKPGVLTDSDAAFGSLTGKVLAVAKTGFSLTTQAVQALFTYNIASNTATAITVQATGKFRAPLPGTPTAIAYWVGDATNSTAGNYKVFDRRTLIGPLALDPEFDPVRDIFRAQYVVSVAAYWRVRYMNAFGYGQAVYFDGATGSTAVGSQSLFTPQKLQSGAAEPGIVTDKLTAVAMSHVSGATWATSDGSEIDTAYGCMVWAQGIIPPTLITVGSPPNEDQITFTGDAVAQVPSTASHVVLLYVKKES